MVEKIYIVTSSWCDEYESPAEEIVGLYWNLQDVKKAIERKRDAVLKERWNVTFENVLKNDQLLVKESDINFFIIDRVYEEKWSMIGVNEYYVHDRKHIDVLFDYNGKTYCEPVYVDDIDLEHYDKVWDWWFRPYVDGSSDDDLNFELTADKNPVGLWSMGNAYINVYKNVHADTPIATVRNIKFRKSWLKAKAFTRASSKPVDD